MKVALVSTGLGRVLRGFESFTESLHGALRNMAPSLDTTLFKGGGSAALGSIVVPNLHRGGLPARWFGDFKGDLLEKRSFALALYPMLRRGHFDLVHYNELVMGSALFHLRRLFGGTFRLLYCNGAPSPPLHYHHRCDFVQLLTEPAFEESRRYGLAEERLFLLPYGVEAGAFSPAARTFRRQTREELGIPQDAQVVLTVAALARDHKRVDHLIREMAGFQGPAWLLAAGQRTTQTAGMEAEAERLIPGRWRFVTWPAHRIPLIYGAADVFVLASLSEAFGLVAVEALFSGLPVLLHDHPVARWIARGTTAELLDMERPGALRERLRQRLAGAGGLDPVPQAADRFSWEALVPKYTAMYERVLANGRNHP